MDRFGQEARYNIAPKPVRIETAPWRAGDPLEPSAIMFVPIDAATWVTDFGGYDVRARLDYDGEGGDAAFLLEETATVGGAQGTYLTAVEGDYHNTKHDQIIHGLSWQLLLPSEFTEALDARRLCLTIQFKAAGSPNWKTAFVFHVPPEYGC